MTAQVTEQVEECLWATRADRLRQLKVTTEHTSLASKSRRQPTAFNTAAMTSTTGQEQQGTLELQQGRQDAGPVECLGLTFENDQARREHFLALLKEKLEDPEFRKIPGFPQGSKEAILRMSDPPYYTACPNPFLPEVSKHFGKSHKPESELDKEPFAVDSSEGKTDQLYRAHAYHTKVPHLAIIPPLLHYTNPGDVVLDGFAGSGMTGLAAQMCGSADSQIRMDIERKFIEMGHSPPEWGSRVAILNDLGPAASFIAAGYNLEFDVGTFKAEAMRIMSEVESELGWMYATLHADGKSLGTINYTLWSEVFTCPHCSSEITFFKEAMDLTTKRVRERFECPQCGASLNKDALEQSFVSEPDPAIKKPWKHVRFDPVLINYDYAGKTYEKTPDSDDLETLEKIEGLPFPPSMPSHSLPIDKMYHGSRLEPKGYTHIHHLFLPRARHALSLLWDKCSEVEDPDTRRAMLFFSEQAIWSMSIMNKYEPIQFGRPDIKASQVGRFMKGVYYISSLPTECSPWYVLHDSKRRSTKLSRLIKAFECRPSRRSSAFIQTGDCSAIQVANNSVDYIFTDPPFGENIFYSDLNFLVEAWHGLATASSREAIVDKHKGKGIQEYQEMMRRCFSEYYRVLKPGKWMTIVFSNSKNSIWRAIQEAIGSSGFVVADVRTLDKQQGSYRQITSSAVKQDLVISAYKPTDILQSAFSLGESSPDCAWAFVREHLAKVPVFVGRGDVAEITSERTAQMLLDRMTAFHVQHGISVPLSSPEFLQGLVQRFPDRDGMYFLPDQVTEYDRKRTTATQLRQLSFFVNDEHSAIQWIRQQLQDKPQSFQDLQPQFMRELQAWAKHEQTVELRVILEQNFLHYDGRGPVPSQIHSYLSTNFKDLRNLDKEDSRLIEKARDRWYVPDPNKQADLDQIRERALLKEFEEIKESSQRRIKQFRTEAVRAGFKACWQEKDYATIVKVAAKLPEAVLQEDEKLLMYIDNAQTRLGDDA